jgi:hypothetical protein
LSDGGPELRIGDGIDLRREIFGKGLLRRALDRRGTRLGSLYVGAHDET